MKWIDWVGLVTGLAAVGALLLAVGFILYWIGAVVVRLIVR